MSKHEHPHGKPISIWNITEENKIIIDNEGLNKIFNHPKVKDRKIAIISLIGAFRGGKSFFLDYCLRFLYAHYSSINNPKPQTSGTFQKNQNWMGEKNEPLKGFSWSSATRRVTTGIVMWSDVFLHTMDGTGEKIAIVVMDTQGLYDKETTLHNNSRIFSLGTLICSIQVLNLSCRIQEDHLQYLQFATEYARFAGVDNQDKKNRPFQKLMFLIRDWNNNEDYNFGIQGGKNYLKEVLQIDQDDKSELTKVRESISSSFEETCCCLLPNPGRAVASSKEFDGSWAKMEDDFKEELQNVVEQLLLPNKLTLKKINSHESIGSEAKKHIESYFRLFESDDMPKVQNFFAATVKSANGMLVEKSLNTYKALLESKGFVSKEQISKVHEECSIKAIDDFKNTKKMGDENHELKYENKLKKLINVTFDDWKKSQFEIAEKLKAEKAKQLAEKEREKAEQETKLAEAERQRAEIAKRQAMEESEEAKREKRNAENRAKNAEQEKQKAVENQRSAEQEKQRAIENQRSAEQEKQRAIENQRNAEQEKQRAIENQRSAENERQKALENQRKAENQVEKEKIRIDELNRQNQLKIEQAEFKAEQAKIYSDKIIADNNRNIEIKDQAESRVRNVEKSMALLENLLEECKKNLEAAEKNNATSKNRIEHLEEKLNEMKEMIKTGDLKIKKGAWGYSEPQDQVILKLVTYINDTE